jgi:hypothetical protein
LMEIPILRGRRFTEQDTETAVPVVVINQDGAKVLAQPGSGRPDHHF